MATLAAEGPGEALPRRFGRYVLFDQIGEGGMARIFLARSSAGLGGDRLLVVKEILPLLADSPEMSRLLVDEAKLCADLTHKNVVQVTDLGREDGRLYIAMEYVEGLDLRELLRACSQRKIPLPVEFSLFIVTETLRALEYAHKKKDESGLPLGIVHRDVSPSNVLLSVEGEVKLCDFGIARVLTTGADLPEEAIQGKAGYMSPEAARGEPVDARSDVFAVGIVLWELLAGTRLYRTGAGRASTLEQAREGSIPPLPARGFPNEERLHAIVGRALSRQPADRHGAAQAMLEEIERYVAENAMGASALKFGDWLVEHFGSEIVERRRERERAAKALVQAPSATATPLASSPRAELPTIPDPNAAGIATTRSHSEPPPRISSRPPPRISSRPPPKRHNPALIAVFVLVALLAGVVAFFLGQR